MHSGLAAAGVISLSADPSTFDVVYAGTTAKGVFKRVTCANGWRAAGLNSLYSLRVAVARNGMLYTGSLGNGMYRSADGGATWVPINNNLTTSDILAVVTDPTNSLVVYAGTGIGGIFKTVDGGANWQSINVGLGSQDIRALAIDPLSGQTIYAATGDRGIYRSTNGGATWQPAATGLGSMEVWVVTIDPSDPQVVYAGATDGVYRSSNYGASWMPTTIRVKTKAVVVDSTDPQHIYAGTSSQGVFRSIDGAQTWSAYNQGLDNLNVHALVLDESGCGLLYAGTQDGVWQIELSPFFNQ